MLTFTVTELRMLRLTTVTSLWRKWPAGAQNGGGRTLPIRLTQKGSTFCCTAILNLHLQTELLISVTDLRPTLCHL
jgi:hypothetical protein